MVQMNSDANKIKENKYKILRMSLLLGNGEDREETVNSFEDAAREIDAMNDEVYLKDLDSKFYDTFKLEDEEKKLSSLVDYIGGRVEQRMSLIEDFSNVAGYELVNLPIIKYQDRLDEYKSRLRYIKEYLSNTERISKLNEEINVLENKLNDAYVKKSKSEEKNIKAEEDLFARFKNIVSNMDLFRGINSDNIDAKLNDVIAVTADSKKSLDIFNKSFSTLNQAGISGEERNEYLSYVNNAKNLFYDNKEEEYLLRIYAMLANTENEYDKLIAKRDTLNELLRERNSLRDDLGIEEVDVLNGLYDLLHKQYEEIKEEKLNIDNIDNYIQEMDSRKIEVKGLEQDNQKVEILSLLKEFCIIDTYEGDNSEDNNIEENIEEFSSDDNTNDTEKLEKVEIKEELEPKADNDDIFANIPPFVPESNNDDATIEEVVEDKKEEEFKEEEKSIEEEKVEEKEEDTLDVTDAKDNQVVSITDVKDMDIKEATSKSNAVMKRVGEMLGVKIEKTIDKKEEDVTISDSKEEPVEDKKEEFEDNSVPEDIFDNKKYDADPETKESNSSLETTSGTNPLFSNELENTTLDEVMANNNVGDVDGDFWASNEDNPLDLNSLPDLTDSNNIFFDNGKKDEGNNMPSLDFPDMDDLYDEEEK